MVVSTILDFLLGVAEADAEELDALKAGAEAELGAEVALDVALHVGVLGTGLNSDSTNKLS